jgi:hypothetical protein
MNLNVAIHPHAPLFSSTLRYGRPSSLYASEHSRISRSGFQVLILKIVATPVFQCKVWARAVLIADQSAASGRC